MLHVYKIAAMLILMRISGLYLVFHTAANNSDNCVDSTLMMQTLEGRAVYCRHRKSVLTSRAMVGSCPEIKKSDVVQNSKKRTTPAYP